MKYTPENAFNLLLEMFVDVNEQDIQIIILAAAEKAAWLMKEDQLAQDIFAVRDRKDLLDESGE